MYTSKNTLARGTGVRPLDTLDSANVLDAGTLICVSRGCSAHAVSFYRQAAKLCNYKHMQSDYRQTYLALIEGLCDIQTSR